MKLRATLFLAPTLFAAGWSCSDASAGTETARPAADEPGVVREASALRGFEDAAPGATLAVLTSGGLQASRITFERARIELGQLYQNEDVPFEFPFRIEGDAAVKITQLDSNCGCTNLRVRADWLPAPAAGAADPALERVYVLNQEIPGGATGAVIGTFNAARIRGEKLSVLTVRGDFDNTPLKLEVHSTVRPVFDVQPAQVRFGDVLVGRADTPPQEIRVVGRGPFEIKQWRRLPAGIRVEPVGEPEATGFRDETARRFRVTLGGDAPEGMLTTACIAETTLGWDLELHVIANVQGPVSYQPPSRLAFGLIPAGEERTRTIEVTANSAGLSLPAPIVEVEGETLAGARIEVETLEANRLHRVRLTLPASAEARPLSGFVHFRYPAGSGIPDRQFPVTGRVTK